MMNTIHEMPRLAAALDQILELTVLLGDDMSRDLRDRGLTRSRTNVIWLIHHRGPLTQRDLAEALGVTARNVTGLVDGLQETGFVTREPHPSDRRALLVTLTDRGRATAVELQQGHEELARMLFAGMPARRFDEFAKGLEHVLGALRTAIAAG